MAANWLNFTFTIPFMSTGSHCTDQNRVAEFTVENYGNIIAECVTIITSHTTILDPVTVLIREQNQAQ
jgi:hypothetical protein